MTGAAESIANQHSTMPAMVGKTMNSASGNSTSNEDAASISANDFLTLLVTEMKNQDPTAQTDPNEYINQLVQVNSLEQLISINQTLTADSSRSSNSSTEATRDANGTASSPAAPEHPVPHTPVPDSLPGSRSRVTVSGNLTVPAVNPAATRVGQALAHTNRH